ncbi:META domain-containing protein [Halosquirtibacter laminarini]|uniref:META domain-containing protein n=1 Tax=Halosquirtibacter laminarini TaxID=3374600 RepID=A0AC61NHJ4_9BACT|nr:META domain-containing protein [Prolixibacteraceae bacterium]
MKYFNYTLLISILSTFLLSSCATSKFSLKKDVKIASYYHRNEEGKKQIVLIDHHGNTLFISPEEIEGTEMQMGYQQTVSMEKDKQKNIYHVKQVKQTVMDSASIRLNDMWVLKKINDKKIAKNAPTLTINLRKETAYGSTGCNRYHSQFMLLGEKKVDFIRIASTKMLCMNANLETEFTSTLEKCDGYAIANNHLTLTKEGKVVLDFQKVD